MQCVIAGNYHEYFSFLERHGLPRYTNNYSFISDPTRLYGMRDATILCVGKYWLSPVCHFLYLEETIKERNIQLLDESGKQAYTPRY